MSERPMRYSGPPRAGCPACGGRVVRDEAPTAVRLERDGADDSHAIQESGTCVRCGRRVHRVARVRAFSEWREDERRTG